MSFLAKKRRGEIEQLEKELKSQIEKNKDYDDKAGKVIEENKKLTSIV